MKPNVLCPISYRMVNERVARINATLTVLLLTVFGLTHYILLAVFLAIDFLLRTSVFSKYSLIGITSRTIVKYIAFNEYFINEGPKIFAARIGLVLSSLIILSYILNVYWLAFVLAGILGLFSFLEAFFGFCIACKIYPYVYKLFYGEKFQR